MKIFVVVLIAAGSLVGCGSPLQQNQAEATFSSNPVGATLVVPGQTAKAPHTWRWNVPPQGMIVPVTATWMSGATKTWRVRLLPGTTSAFSLDRPPAPNLDIDVRWAIHLSNEDQKAAEDLQDSLSSTAKSIGGAIGRAAGK